MDARHRAKTEGIVGHFPLACAPSPHGALQLGFSLLAAQDEPPLPFLVIRDKKPWFLVEVKKRNTHLSLTLAHFKKQVGALHAFQAVVDLDYEQIDCFKHRGPVVVPARTLLSQLL